MRKSVILTVSGATGISRDTLYLFLMIFFPVALYAPVLLNGNGFIWDDPWMLLNNPQVKSLSTDNILHIFTASYGGQYSPVNSVYYLVLYQLFGFDPFVFHLFNILMHILNGLLVFTFIREMMAMKNGEETPRQLDIAFTCALLFSITTVQVEVVAWISASKIVMYAMFFLLSIIAYLRFCRSGSWKMFALSHVCYILSIGAKEQAVILPLSLILTDYYIQKRFSFRQQWNKVLFFLIALISGIVSLKIQDSGFKVMFANDYYPLWQRFVLSFYSSCQYVVKILLPLKVGTFYGFPMKSGEPLPSVFWIYLPVGILIGYYLIRFRHNKALIWGTLFFIVNLALSLHILPLGRESLMADRYCYISVIGVFFFLSERFFAVFDNRRSLGKWLPALGLLYLTFIFVRTFIYVQSWTLKG